MMVRDVPFLEIGGGRVVLCGAGGTAKDAVQIEAIGRSRRGVLWLVMGPR